MAKPWEDDRVVGQEEAAAVVAQQAAAWEGDDEVAAPTGAEEAAVAPQEDDNWALFNRNLMQALMGPVDLANAPNRAIHQGLDWLFGTERSPEEQAVVYQQPSDRAKSLMTSVVGTEFADRDAVPHTLGGKAAAAAGTAAGLLPAIGLGGGAAAGYQGPGQSVINPIGQSIASSFGTPLLAAQTSALEMGAAAGMPYGGEAAARAAEHAGYGETGVGVARDFGELAGSFAAPLAGAAAGAGVGLARYSPGLSIANQIYQRARHPLDASFTRAPNAVRGRVADPEAAAAALDNPAIMPMPPGMRTGDPALMSLDRSVVRSDPSTADWFRDQEAKGMEDIRAYLSGLSNSGDINKAKEAASQYAQIAQRRIDTEVSNALARAEDAVQAAGPRGGADPETLSQVFMDELETARAAARQIEKEAWEVVPKDIKAVPQNVKETFRAIEAERGVEGAGAIAPYFRNIITGEWTKEPSRTVQQISTFRSEALNVARTARARGDFSTANVANRLAEAARVDLDGIDTVNPALEAARSISRDYHSRFTQGEIGRVLQYDATGASRVDPQMALRRLIGNKTGESLSASTSAIDRAFGAPNDPTNPGTLLVDDYFRTGFEGAIRTPDGFNPTRAEAWMDRRSTVMSRYPALGEVVDRAIGATRSYEGALRKKAADEATLKRSASVVFKDSPVHQEFDKILTKTPDPRATMQELVAATRIVPQPEEAVNGLRKAATDYLLRGANKHITSRGDIVQGQKFSTMMSDPRTREALEVLYAPDQMAVLDDIALNLSRYDMMHNNTTNSGGELVPQDAVDWAVDNLAKFVGVKAGGVVGQGSGSSLHIASQGRKIATTIANRLNKSGAEALLRDAVQDPKLYQELLRGKRESAGGAFHYDLPDDAAPNLTAWLSTAPQQFFDGDKEDTQDAWEDALSTVGGVLTR